MFYYILTNAEEKYKAGVTNRVVSPPSSYLEVPDPSASECDCICI